jgi:hypothetical protein
MTSQPQSGIACKTCRRRGRKCDRTLPKCMSCHSRGVECEGYPLRWVGLAARGRMAARTYQSVTADPAPREKQASVRLVSKIDDSNVGGELSQRLGARVLEGQYYAHQYSRSANCTSSGDVMELHLLPSPRRPTWNMPATLLPPDGLQVFIKYCKDRSSR